ncbi:hypothetical protein NECAME_07945 [Necator americanus]|uniref:Uncharacterized protein n=1 Tax=Necator americanus TaxID=51031 RepID=W2TLJ3_NECAM|nr:hypothetical protein NECAME_07945 [Necator americanus]ETN82499.1 hypothetical protein NECAME_07945 [Necator americanus]
MPQRRPYAAPISVPMRSTRVRTKIVRGRAVIAPRQVRLQKSEKEETYQFIEGRHSEALLENWNAILYLFRIDDAFCSVTMRTHM